MKTQDKGLQLQSISAMRVYEKKSSEELRWEDVSGTATVGGLASPPNNVSPFGSTTKGSNPFGGGAATGGFGAASSTGGGSYPNRILYFSPW